MAISEPGVGCLLPGPPADTAQPSGHGVRGSCLGKMAKPGKVSGFKTAGSLFHDLRGNEVFNVGLPEQHAPAELDVGEHPSLQVPMEGRAGDVQKVENLGDRQELDIHQNPSLAETSPGFK